MNISDKEFLLKFSRTSMPYGKFKGTLLIDLPEYYVLWICANQIPKGELGNMFLLLNEIKVNGLEPLIRNLSKIK